MRLAWSFLAGSLGVLGLAGVLYAQQQDAVTCEMQVGSDYRQLTSSPGALLPETQATTWATQLAAMVMQLRVVSAQLTIEELQNRQAKRSVAELEVVIRQLQTQLAQARAPLEKPAAPAN